MGQNNVHIAVLGAGVTGLTAALTLAKQGYKVTCYDPAGFPAMNASAMAGGMLAPYAEIEHMPMAFVEAGLQSIPIWEDLCPEFITQKGSLLVAHPQDAYILKRFQAHLPKELKSIHKTENIEPNIANIFEHGLYLKEEAHLDPSQVMDNMLAQLKALGCHLKAEKMDNKGQYDFILDCRGIAMKDTHSDLRGVKGETALVRNTEFTLTRPVRLMHPRYPLYIIPREDHIFMIGATIIESEDEQVSMRSAMELTSALYALHPSFGDSELLEFKAGIRPSYLDNLPRITRNDKVISINGMFRHGWLMAPIMARCVADMITGEDNNWTHLFLRGQDEGQNQWSKSDNRAIA